MRRTGARGVPAIGTVVHAVGGGRRCTVEVEEVRERKLDSMGWDGMRWDGDVWCGGELAGESRRCSLFVWFRVAQ